MNLSVFPSADELKALPRIAGPGCRYTNSNIEISLLIPARNAADSLERTVREAHSVLQNLFPGRFEIVAIANPKPGDQTDRTFEVARELARRFPEVRPVLHRSPPGKGAAMRSGFLACSGKRVFFTDADLPYDLEFLRQACEKLDAGFDLVTGNRRLLNSEFEVPVELLRLAYGRHRLGLAFNRVVRWLMPLGTTDTQAGIKGMSRRLSETAFSLQSCPGFFFDLELILTAKSNAWKVTELPIVLHLNSEKSTVRLIRESILAGFWLLRIAFRYRLGAYASKKLSP